MTSKNFKASVRLLCVIGLVFVLATVIVETLIHLS
jgi:hypothetical protein